jgi:lipocalin-like protein
MKQLISLTTAALLLGILLPEGRAVAQTANDHFRGTSWTLISGRIERGGREVRLTAPRLQGFLMFDSNDHFLIAIIRSGAPKPASNSSNAGTFGENKALLQRSIACFGTYSINDAEHTINAHIERSSFPKWVGTDQKRFFIVAGDKLKWTNSPQSGGAGTAELVWKRVK